MPEGINFRLWGSLNLTHTISTDASGALNKAYPSTGTYVRVSTPWKNKLDYKKSYAVLLHRLELCAYHKNIKIINRKLFLSSSWLSLHGLTRLKIIYQ